jgi:hypothetical protein
VPNARPAACAVSRCTIDPLVVYFPERGAYSSAGNTRFMGEAGSFAIRVASFGDIGGFGCLWHLSAEICTLPRGMLTVALPYPCDTLTR